MKPGSSARHFPLEKLARFFLSLITLFFAHPLRAENSLSQTAFEILPGQHLLLKGDSIVKGYGFGNYTNASPLRTLYGIANILLKENLSHPAAMIRLEGVWSGLNPDGRPKTVDSLAGEIQTQVRHGEIRPGDWLIYEDAGELDKVVHPPPWPDAKNMYARHREALRGMILEAVAHRGSTLGRKCRRAHGHL